MALKRNGLWIVYAVFVVVAIYFHDGESLFTSQGAFPAGKIIAWLMWMGFLIYSIYISTKENFFRTVKAILPLHWARQISIDLYIGIAFAMFIIYLNEGSLLVLMLWLLPLLIFANLATLLYIAMNYDSIVAHFL